MPFEVNNFAIRTWNAILVSECRFVMSFSSHKFAFRLWTKRPVLGIYSFAFETPLNSAILRTGLSVCVN